MHLKHTTKRDLYLNGIIAFFKYRMYCTVSDVAKVQLNEADGRAFARHWSDR